MMIYGIARGLKQNTGVPSNFFKKINVKDTTVKSLNNRRYEQAVLDIVSEDVHGYLNYISKIHPSSRDAAIGLIATRFGFAGASLKDLKKLKLQRMA